MHAAQRVFLTKQRDAGVGPARQIAGKEGKKEGGRGRRGRGRGEGGEEGEGPDASARENVKTNEVCVCELRERSGTYSIHAYACS